MKKGFLIVVMALSACFFTYAQQEQAAQSIAEKEHKKLASDLSSVLRTGKGKPVFGNAGKDKQFLLVDDEETFATYLGWKKAQFNKRNLITVYQSLLKETKQKDPKKKVSVRVAFPLDGAEVIGEATNKGKPIPNTYLVSTTAEVAIEATKQGAETSLAKSTLTLSWNVTLKVNKKTNKIEANGSRAVLQSISAESSSGYFLAEKEQMQSIANKLIKDYYQSLVGGNWAAVEIPSDWRNPLQTSVKRETEGEVYVDLPSSTSFSVNTVPALKIFVNPEAYHKVALTFGIAIDDDKKSGRIASISYSVLETPRIVVEETESVPEPVFVAPPQQQQAPPPPVVRDRVSGLTYKVQILSLYRPVPLEELPARFRMNNVSIEKYIVDGVIYFKYVVPGGTLSEAVSVRRQMRDNGIEDAWIAIYENGARIAPREGDPEIIR